MKQIYSRVPDELHRKFSVACIDRGVNRPSGLMAAIKLWVEGETVATAGQGIKTPVIGSRLSDAILNLESVRNTLVEINHDLTKSSGVSTASGDISREIEGIPGSSGEHLRAVGDLGPGTEKPGAWRKLPKPKGPTRTGPT